MKRTKSIILFTIWLLYTAINVSAIETDDSVVVSHTDSVMIHFRQSKWDLDLTLGDNATALDNIGRRLTTVLNDSVYQLRHVSVFGGASPEGTVSFNRFLSEQRAETLFDWFDKYNRFSNLGKTFTCFGRDWDGVLRLAENDPALPYRDETLALLRTIVSEKRSLNGDEPELSLERMKSLRGGVPYRYLYRYIFPTVRASKVVIEYDRVLASEIMHKEINDKITTVPVIPSDTVFIDIIEAVHDTIYFDQCPKTPFYMDIRSNMLYDLLAVPNIGVEFYLGKNWSIAGSYMHAWWSHDARHRYWRLYGGELNARYWFGKAADSKPLTGHHIGLYAQALTYDFEWGGKAYMGGEPRGTIFDRAHFGGGVEYGYSRPVATRFNIDFTLGVGYISGRVYEFVPQEGRYIWTATKNRRWFGPTKLEISLVWLIGRGNFNKSKGGGL